MPVHTLLRRLAEAVGTIVLSTLVYFLIPSRVGGHLGNWAFVVAFTGGLVVVSGVILGQLRRYGRARSRTNASIAGLVLALYVSVLFFAKVYDSLAVSRPGALVGLGTKIDALYFSLAIASTTGFGDVHAVGQLARMVVIVQMAFNVGFLGVALAAVRRIVIGGDGAALQAARSRADLTGATSDRAVSRAGTAAHPTGTPGFSADSSGELGKFSGGERALERGTTEGGRP
jgi:hypothetical protein